MRPLAKTDLSRGFISVLTVLTSAPEVSETRYAETFDAMKSFNNYFTLVIVSRATDKIVGSGTVFIEQKFIRNLGKVGHIEDIVVDKNMQGRKLGLRIINALTEISETRGCYKTILNCSEDNARKSVHTSLSIVFHYLFFGMLLTDGFFFQHSIKNVDMRREKSRW